VSVFDELMDVESERLRTHIQLGRLKYWRWCVRRIKKLERKRRVLERRRPLPWGEWKELVRELEWLKSSREEIEEREGGRKKIEQKYKLLSQKLQNLRERRRALMGKVRDEELTPEQGCWLCLRVTPQLVFEVAHVLVGDDEVAHEVATRALNIVRDLYLADPAFLSGKSALTIMGGALYLVVAYMRGRNLDVSSVTQKKVAMLLGTRECTVRNMYWWMVEKMEELNLLEKYFPRAFSPSYRGGTR